MTKLLCLLLLYLPVATRTPATDPIDNAAELLKAGNVHELSKTFAPTVDMTVLNVEGTFPAAKAETVLADFLSKNKVKSVSILHRVDSNPNIRFAVLLLSTNTGFYRTSLSYQLVNGVFLLNDLHVEVEKK
jgi:hypothetical protein